VNITHKGGCPWLADGKQYARGIIGWALGAESQLWRSTTFYIFIGCWMFLTWLPTLEIQVARRDRRLLRLHVPDLSGAQHSSPRYWATQGRYWGSLAGSWSRNLWKFSDWALSTNEVSCEFPDSLLLGYNTTCNSFSKLCKLLGLSNRADAWWKMEILNAAALYLLKIYDRTTKKMCL
jgi:hypothetical protein